jgi:hypothetical protein
VNRREMLSGLLRSAAVAPLAMLGFSAAKADDQLDHIRFSANVAHGLRQGQAINLHGGQWTMMHDYVNPNGIKVARTDIIVRGKLVRSGERASQNTDR